MEKSKLKVYCEDLVEIYEALKPTFIESGWRMMVFGEEDCDVYVPEDAEDLVSFPPKRKTVQELNKRFGGNWKKTKICGSVVVEQNYLFYDADQVSEQQIKYVEALYFNAGSRCRIVNGDATMYAFVPFELNEINKEVLSEYLKMEINELYIKED